MLEMIQSITSIVAVTIAICTLKQTAKQIEESTRPYLTVYQTRINLGEIRNILILKNFGKSAAKINSIEYDEKLLELSYADKLKPFASTIGTTIAPGQSFKCEIKSATSEDFIVNFKIKYSSLSEKEYLDTVSLKLDSNRQNIQQRIDLKDPNLNKVFYAIQEMIEQNL